MNIKCGIDIIEVERIKENIEGNAGEKFLKKVYTQNEINYCESKKITKYEHYAARFAAKEAVFKAISPILEGKYNINWTDIEILNNSDGRPFARINEEKVKNIQIDISMSHIKEYATANCVVIF